MENVLGVVAIVAVSTLVPLGAARAVLGLLLSGLSRRNPQKAIE